MYDQKREQRINLKFLVELKKTPVECYELLKQAYGENSLSREYVLEWYRRYFEGQESSDDDQRLIPLAADVSTVNKICDTLRRDPHISVQMISEYANIDEETVRKILYDELNMKRVCGKLVQRTLTPEDRLARKQICLDFLERLDEEPELMENVIVFGETWMFHTKSSFNIVLIIFFDINGIVMTEWVSEDQTVNQTYYLKVLATLQEQICKKRPTLLKNKSWILYHDKPAYNALCVERYLAARGIPAFKHTTDSPDLAPCDFFLFPKIKCTLKPRETQFASMEEIRQKSEAILNALTKEEFQLCFTQWKKRMELCAAGGGKFLQEEEHSIVE